MKQGVDQRAGPVAGRGMDDQARWLVQTNEVIILVENLDRNVFRLRIAARLLGRRFLGLHFVSGVKSVG